ncbi:helix-turn-helix domain-containing protein [Embleya sp. NPDC005575]|uniref:helix-turn-helix domain-containing protein n=1 Tax=Embleya sp. NPDC005575 TaxID=3156892 RepID=UPI0033AAF792
MVFDPTRTYRLAELRHRAALTQVEVAAAIGVSQNAVSKLENGAIERSALITLKNYIEALGGHLEVVARFDGETLRLS